MPWCCPGLALESAQNPFDVLAMTFFTQKAFGRTLEGLQKGYLGSSPSPLFKSSYCIMRTSVISVHVQVFVFGRFF